jgi:hypothetical protein
MGQATVPEAGHSDKFWTGPFTLRASVVATVDGLGVTHAAMADARDGTAAPSRPLIIKYIKVWLVKTQNTVTLGP